MEEKKRVNILEIIFIFITVMNFILAFLGEDVVGPLSNNFFPAMFLISVILLVLVGIFMKKSKEKNKLMVILILIAHEFIIMNVSVLIKCFCRNIRAGDLTTWDKIFEIISKPITFIPILIYFVVLIRKYFKKIQEQVESDDFGAKNIMSYIIVYTIIGVCVGCSRQIVKILTGLHH